MCTVNKCNIRDKGSLITARKANSRRPGSPESRTLLHHRQFEKDSGILPSKTDDKWSVSTSLYFYKCIKRNFFVNGILALLQLPVYKERINRLITCHHTQSQGDASSTTREESFATMVIIWRPARAQ